MQDREAAELHAGRVLNESIAQVRRNLVVFALLAMTVSWPALLATRSMATQIAGAEASQSASLLTDLPGWLLITLVVILLILVFMIYAVAAAAIAYGVNEGLQGRRAGFLECVVKTMPRAMTVMGVELGVGFLGLMAIFVAMIPGLVLIFAGAGFLGQAVSMIGASIAAAMVFSAYWVAVPVAIIEGQEPSFCMGRSRKLTKGSRFPIFVLLLLTEGVYWLIQWLSGKLFGGVGIPELSWMETVFDMAVAPLFIVWAAVVSAVTYCNLRVLREGWQPDSVADIFE